MIRKESSDGVGFSVVDLTDVRHVFASAAPRNGGTLREQARDALRTIEAVIAEEGARGSIVHQAVFVKDADLIEECQQIMREFYKDEMPAIIYIPQPPCDGKLVSIEALGVGRGMGEVEIIRYSEQLVATRHDGITWFHCGQTVPNTTANGVYDRSISAFNEMQKTLASHGVKYEQIIRTWLYLGDIVGPEGETQRYKELNRARTDFYRDFHFGDGRIPDTIRQTVYPASTGIGTSNCDVTMSCIALLSDRDDVILMPLENPQQVAAFDYAEHYSPESPKFCRAMAIAAGDCATILVSGTASITDSETRFIDDVEGQTNQTLDNIAALISEGNFKQHGMPGLGATLDDLALVRVYVKRQEDYEKTRAICQQRLGELPIIYAIGDVCREDLLVEIEGIAFSRACLKVDS